MRSDTGFTLAEVMAALAVFSIAALALLHLSAENARAAGLTREHAFAALIAENLMVEAVAQPELVTQGIATGSEQMDGREWDWTRTVLDSGEPGMFRIDVQVRVAGESHVSAALTGFRSGR